MSDKLMDTAPGGETPQYESIKTVDKPTPTQKGQLGNASSDPDVDQSTERGEKTAENVRYGQGISEGGFGGKTTDIEGSANQGGYGGTGAQDDVEDPAKARREQQYGDMPNIGA